jgi:uncharacterized protein YqhQ
MRRWLNKSNKNQKAEKDDDKDAKKEENRNCEEERKKERKKEETNLVERFCFFFLGCVKFQFEKDICIDIDIIILDFLASIYIVAVVNITLYVVLIAMIHIYLLWKKENTRP